MEPQWNIVEQQMQVGMLTGVLGAGLRLGMTGPEPQAAAMGGAFSPLTQYALSGVVHTTGVVLSRVSNMIQARRDGRS